MEDKGNFYNKDGNYIDYLESIDFVCSKMSFWRKKYMNILYIEYGCPEFLCVWNVAHDISFLSFTLFSFLPYLLSFHFFK